MAKAIIINNPIELCENWGWYVDIESQNKYLQNNNNKYKIRKFKPIRIIEIYEEEENKINDEYEYYINQVKKNKIKNSLETIFEEEEKTDCKNPKILCSGNILRLSSVTIITGIIIYIILFTI